jgi:hypothetical protein
MRTPAGTECPHFFGDYYRGREREECRLLKAANPPQKWTPDLCSTCPVPDILSANACPNMILKPEIIRPFPFLKREVRIKPYCIKSQQDVSEPKIGCGQCHPLPQIFFGETGEPDPSS